MWENRHCSNFQLQWKFDFRVNRLNFEKLVDLVRPRLWKHDTQLRKAILIEKRVAVAFPSVGKSTVVTITREFCTEIFRLSSKFIKFPISQLETAKAMENFKQDCSCKIPQALGVIDGLHIFIEIPENERKYYCRKQRYSYQYPSGCRGLLIISWCSNWLSRKHARLSKIKTFLTFEELSKMKF